ncbi:MAG: ubiquitin-like small modifier protein 1 [Anaerolineales bacterium]
MKIKFYGGLRQIAGTKEQGITGATIREVLEKICADNESLRMAIFDGTNLHRHVRVMVNGRDSELALGLDTPVFANDQIAIFPPIAGGQE